MKTIKSRKPLDILIGQRLKEAREGAGHTQGDFSELIGMTSQNLSDVERGVTGISVSMLKTICQTLYISSDWLIMDESVKTDDDEMLFLIERLRHLSPKQGIALYRPGLQYPFVRRSQHRRSLAVSFAGFRFSN